MNNKCRNNIYCHDNWFYEAMHTIYTVYYIYNVYYILYSTVDNTFSYRIFFDGIIHEYIFSSRSKKYIIYLKLL